MGDSDLKMEIKRIQFRDFLTEQNQGWKLSADNYSGLDHVEEKTFLIGGYEIKVQFNPERIRSSSAKVDKDSISARKCFLCSENRPVEQNKLDMGNDFLLLVNPFPIFKTHFTLPSVHHIPQLLISALDAMFDISRQMQDYLLFYNGPECGASAPDHLHFQAGETGFLPVEQEFNSLKKTAGSLILESKHLNIWAFDQYLRKMISFETGSIQMGIRTIETILNCLGKIQPGKAEPMVNLLCYYKNGKWIVHLFPRKMHRPTQFFAHGTDQLLISPASVDFGGVFITPRRDDFDKITAADVTDIFSQVSLDDENFELLKRSLTN
ncbi:MAG TPA: DUF4922 domain-containing protein [Prolixibacteraceae bacterium]|nr:DUF4922 domain-containing protein [Prolixibacteraceae bacterium]